MIYTKVFVKIYNWLSRKLVHETYEIVKLEKYPVSRAKNSLNFGGQQFYKISKVLQSAHVMPKATENKIFYLNNYINLHQFNQLYNSKE